MARAITRVELHEDDERTKVLKITSEEYLKLHAEMWKRGFRRFVTTGDNEMQHLPPANTPSKVRYSRRLDGKIKAAAFAAVNSHKRYSYIVTRTTESRKWYNLKTIKKDPDA